MNPQESESAAIRRWVIEIGRLRTRLGKVARRIPPGSHEAGDLSDSCLALCDSLLQELAASEVRCGGLAREKRAIETEWNGFVEELPVACLEVDAAGTIVSANTAAGVLLNTSRKHLESRALLYFCEDRDSFTALLRASAFDGGRTPTPLVIRPRERAPVPVQAIIAGRNTENASTQWWWFLTTSDALPRTTRSRRDPRSFDLSASQPPAQQCKPDDIDAAS
jgi:PAS domain-containing protein